MNEENKNIKSTQGVNNQPQVTPNPSQPQVQPQINQQPVEQQNLNVKQVQSPPIQTNIPVENQTQQPTPVIKQEQPIINPEPSLLKEQEDSSVTPKEKTKEESNKSLILVGIFFTVMFAFIMFLPTINSYITELKEKKLEEEITDPIDEDEQNKDNDQTIPGNTNGKEVKVVCTSEESTTTDLSSMHITYTYIHIDDKIKKVEKDIIYTYATATTEAFIAQEKKCDSEIKANNNQAGYNASCKLNENTITITETFDLTTFKTFTGANGTTISPVTELDSSLKAEIEELTNQGYKCQ